MVRRLIWTVEAQNSRKNIFEYWNNRNKPKQYSKKLNFLFNQILKTTQNYPDLGKPTNYHNVKLFIISHFEIIYKITDSEIVVLDIWDTRQNPQNFPLK